MTLHVTPLCERLQPLVDGYEKFGKVLTATVTHTAMGNKVPVPVPGKKR